MKIKLTIIIVFLFSHSIQAQYNCNVFLWNGDTAQYKACKLLIEDQNNYYQFSKAFHHLVDSAIAICPHFAYAYREKAAAYVKAGNFIAWKKNIDLAVKYDSLAYLPVRASLRYKFFADYDGTIQDIVLFEKISKSNIGYTSNGTYHLLIIKALCYKQLGKTKDGIDIIEQLMAEKNYTAGLYDYLHLGVMYAEMGDYDKAINALNKQLTRYECAEVQYYLAVNYKKVGNKAAYLEAKQAAANLYKNNKRMFDQYHYMIDQIFEKDINKV